MTELEVRVAMFAYAARRVLEVSGGGMGIGAPAWLWASVDIAFRVGIVEVTDPPTDGSQETTGCRR